MKFLFMALMVAAWPAVAMAASFSISSPAFDNNGDVPAQYTCHGGNVNPPLAFSNIPAKTQSLALTVSDPDAPQGVWVHWVVFNINPKTTQIAENTIPGTQGLNDFGKYIYQGPCPPDEKAHHYVFRAYALNTILNIDEGSTMKDLEKAVRGHTLAKAQLVGFFRKPLW